MSELVCGVREPNKNAIAMRFAASISDSRYKKINYYVMKSEIMDFMLVCNLAKNVVLSDRAWHQRLTKDFFTMKL